MRSQDETVRIVSAWLRKRHGDAVTLEFVSISDPSHSVEVAAQMACARSQHVKPPFAVADGKLLPVPWFSNWTLYDSVEAYLSSLRAESPTPADPDEMDLRDYGTD